MATSTQLITRKFILDDEGKNYLLIQSNNKVINLKLKLERDKKLRKIGRVTKSTKILEVRRVRAKHLFIKGNAYGFNHYILENSKTFKTISLFDGIKHWKIPVEFILKEGVFLIFKQQGFERQLFVSLQQIEQYEVKPNTNRRF